ncbi:GNAT family N-acetyltransferase [Jannaschia sp. AI_61]|nr:GNAT family N-acetyltransferase [Jannaschia sp. AI_61]
MPLTIPTLTTERLILRAPTRADFAPSAALLASARATYMGGPYDRAAAWAQFTGACASWLLEGFGSWMITDRATGAWLGETGITHPDHFPEPELGWMVAPEAEGQGIAHEAARAAQTWGLQTRGLATFVSYVDPENIRSLALARRLGARQDDSAQRPAGETPADTTVFRHGGRP